MQHEQRPRQKRFAILLMLGTALAAGVIWLNTQTGETEMSQDFASASSDVAQYEPFPDEIAAVETAWGEPIPDHLVRIGGVDWWSWASVQKIVQNDQIIFRGEYRDARLRYRGDFIYQHPQGNQPPEAIFENYIMTHISDIDLVFVKNDDIIPKDNFVLKPANPEAVERR